jgi:hypothetical protein
MLRNKVSVVGMARRGRGRKNRRATRVSGSLNDNPLPLYRQPTELKYYDTTVTQFANQVGTLTGLDYPSQTVAADGRVGNAITVRGLDVRYICNLTGASTRDTVRLVLFVDMQGYNTPVVTDVIQAAGVGTAFAPIVPFNYTYRLRFKVLHEEVFSLTTAFSTYSSAKRLGLNLTTTFVGASTFTNQIYWLIMSDEGNPLQYPLVNAAFRVTYTDS